MLVATLAASFATRTARAAPKRHLGHKARATLSELYAAQPRARGLGDRAQAILVFPRIVKVGMFLEGGQTGDGVLLAHQRPAGLFHLSGATARLQTGGQAYSCVLFVMNASALAYLDRSEGWTIGDGPKVVVVEDDTAAPDLSATSATEDVYAFPFGAKGLIAGSGIDGARIKRMKRARPAA